MRGRRHSAEIDPGLDRPREPAHATNAAEARKLARGTSQIGLLRANAQATLAVYELLKERLPEA